MQGKQQIEARLSQAFMLADVRDSERTTAEEVRLQALQIEEQPWKHLQHPDHRVPGAVCIEKAVPA